MTVQNRIVIGFAIPEETTEMLEFGEKNKDFIAWKPLPEPWKGGTT